jgi:hypothetical protein
MHDDNHNQPKIVYTLPYFTYLRFERWKFYFWILVAVSILSNVLMANLAIVFAVVPKPLMNHILGITPEMARNQAHNEVLIERRERFEKQEKTREEALVKARLKAYNIESAKKSRAEMDKDINNPHVSEETARGRAFK